MKLTKVEKRFSDAGPGFNHKAAEEVFKAVMDCPDNESASFFTRALVLDVMGRDIVRHGEFLSKAMEAADEERITKVRDALARQYVSKRLKGEDVTEIAKAAEYLGEISKDGVYDFQARSRNAKKQRRNQGGRFVAEHKNIKYDSKAPVDEHVFNRIYGTKMPQRHGPGSSKAGKPLSDQEKRNWQIAYQESQDLIGNYGDLPGAMVHLRYGNNEYQVRPKDLDSHLSGNKRPNSIAVSVDNRFDTPGPYNFYQMGTALGGTGVGARMQNAAGNTEQEWRRSGLNPERVGRYNEANQKFDQGAAYQPGGRLFQRLNNGSSLLEDMAGENAPEKLKAALAAGRWVGEYGPEAQRAIGPSVQRNAYRYRGVERQPDQKLTSIFAGINNSDQLKNASVADKVRFAIASQHRDPSQRNKEILPPAVKYFRDRLPKANLNTLQTASGNIPPSEGILVNRKGDVVTQAVGYGDDWYLPFNLKNVGRMNGGSYIRTRTFGGPTTEDVYTGLMSGANQLSVISHNGVYTVEFDESFKGGRRYNDKAARMVTRYGQILDAVKSEQVVLDMMDPSRKRELRLEAARNVRDPDSKQQVDAELARLTNAERLHPKLSEEQLTAVKRDVLNDYASTVKTKGRDLQAEDLRGYALSQYAQQTKTAGLSTDNEAFTTSLANLNDRLATEDGLIAQFGLQEQLQRRTDKETNRIRRDLSPLALNGRGYELALEALQEQFPYYIKKPTFREWDEISNSKDSGYIKPRHIRPEAALAGYFDGSIIGKPGENGKVTADSIATGNYRTGSTNFQRASRPAPTEQVSATGGNGVGLRSSETVNSSPSASSGRAPIPAIVRDEADKNLAIHLREAAAKASEDADHKFLYDSNAANAEQRNLAQILNMSDADVDDAIDRDPDGFNERLLKATAAANRVDGMKSRMDAKIVDESRRRGAPPEARKLPDDASKMLGRPGEEWEFGRRFEPSKNNTPDDVLRFEKEDSDIAHAQSRGLPSIADPKFTTKANEKVPALRAHYRTMSADRTQRYGAADLRDTESEARGVVKAMQLKRRLGEAQSAADEAANAPVEATVVPQGGTDTFTRQRVIVTDNPEFAQSFTNDNDVDVQFEGNRSRQITRGMSDDERNAEWQRIAKLPMSEQRQATNALLNRLRDEE